MEILICNVPLRDASLKTVYPPLGAMAIIQSLRSAGYDPDFYDINYYRPDDERLRKYFIEKKFDIVGISATVSTSYAYVKKLSALIKSCFPDTVVIVGGALTASAEIVLRYSRTDFCVVGEGERVIVNLVNHISKYGADGNRTPTREIKGVCFMAKDGTALFTGYEKQLAIDEIQDADYGIIEKFSSIDQYIIDPLFYEQVKYDKRFYEERRKGKGLATIITSRGCVNRCSFCYRWQRGIRVFPVDRVIKTIKHMMQKYNVGFISFGDEDFGASKKWTEELIEKIAPLDILYRISGICCDNVDLPLLKKLKDSGCVSVHYGFESGSNDILKVMEKRADAAMNTRVAVETSQAGLHTVTALVVGMPGESYRTIEETIAFVNKITEVMPKQPIISANVLITLPGTPVFEYARYRGLLGKTLDDEEKYLVRISDRGGASMRQLNLTDYPYFIVQSWIRCIVISARYNYYNKNNLKKLPASELIIACISMMVKGKKNIRPLSADIYSNTVIYHARYVVALLLVMFKNLKEDRALFFERCVELFAWPFRKKKFTEYVPLRNYLKEKVQVRKSQGGMDIRLLRQNV